MEESKIIIIIRSFFFSKTRMTFKLDTKTLFKMVLQRSSDISEETISEKELEKPFLKAVNQMVADEELAVIEGNEKLVDKSIDKFELSLRPLGPAA